MLVLYVVQQVSIQEVDSMANYMPIVRELVPGVTEGSTPSNYPSIL